MNWRTLAAVALLVLVPFILPASSLPSSVLRAIPLARVYWGPAPCGRLRVVVTPLHIPEPLNGLTNAGYALPARCLIVLDPDFVEQMPDWLICESLLHEAGHLHGRGHSLNPAAIMFRQLGRHHYPCRSTR